MNDPGIFRYLRSGITQLTATKRKNKSPTSRIKISNVTYKICSI